MTTVQQYCTFFLDDLYFGVRVESVQEVLRYQPMTGVPLASDLIRGLINLRGQIVTAIEMRRQLDLPSRDADLEPMNVILRDDEGAVSLLVDEIGDVVEVDQARFEETPSTVPDNVSAFIRGVYKLDENLLLVLDTDKVIHGVAEQSTA